MERFWTYKDSYRNWWKITVTPVRRIDAAELSDPSPDYFETEWHYKVEQQELPTNSWRLIHQNTINQQYDETLHLSMIIKDWTKSMVSLGIEMAQSGHDVNFMVRK